MTSPMDHLQPHHQTEMMQETMDTRNHSIHTMAAVRMKTLDMLEIVLNHLVGMTIIRIIMKTAEGTSMKMIDRVHVLLLVIEDHVQDLEDEEDLLLDFGLVA
jgi:hypothetical protein